MLIVLGLLYIAFGIVCIGLAIYLAWHIEKE